jgi:acyl-CoA thioester hydrolase
MGFVLYSNMLRKELYLTYKGIVYPHQCDHMGHMNVMWYVSKFDEATWQLVNFGGISGTYMRGQNRGMAAVDQRIIYKRELLPGSLVCVQSGIIEVKAKTIRFFHEMLNEETGEVAAITILTGVHMDTGVRKAVEIPEDIAIKVKSFITEYRPEI